MVFNLISGHLRNPVFEDKLFSPCKCEKYFCPNSIIGKYWVVFSLWEQNIFSSESLSIKFPSYKKISVSIKILSKGSFYKAIILPAAQKSFGTFKWSKILYILSYGKSLHSSLPFSSVYKTTSCPWAFKQANDKAQRANDYSN
jgi:hypothetical protein